MIVLSFGKKRQFTTIAFDGDGTRLAAGGDHASVVVWDIAARAELHRIDRVIGHPTQSLAFHPRSAWLYIAHSYGLTAVDTSTGETRELWEKEQFAQNLALDATGHRLVGARHQLWTNRNDLRWLTCVSVAEPGNPHRAWDRNGEFASLLTFFPDGTKFAAAHAYDFQRPSDTPRITIHSADTGDTVQTIRGPHTEAEQLAVAPGRETLVVRVNRRLRILDLSNATQPPKELQNSGRSHFTEVAFHPSGRFLAATSNDQTVKLYDTTTWELARTFTWEIGKMRSIAFSADGTLAAAGSDKGKVVVWDVDV